MSWPESDRSCGRGGRRGGGTTPVSGGHDSSCGDMSGVRSHTATSGVTGDVRGHTNTVSGVSCGHSSSGQFYNLASVIVKNKTADTRARFRHICTPFTQRDSDSHRDLSTRTGPYPHHSAPATENIYTLHILMDIGQGLQSARLSVCLCVCLFVC